MGLSAETAASVARVLFEDHSRMRLATPHTLANCVRVLWIAAMYEWIAKIAQYRGPVQ